MANTQGIITFISAKTKGLHLDNNDVWFNPKGEVTDKIKKEMEGTKVVLHLLEGSNSFTSFDVLEAPSKDTPQTASKDDYWQRKEDRDVAQDRAKGRGASLNTAIDILKLSEDRPRDEEGLLKEAKELALDINKWVMQ